MVRDVEEREWIWEKDIRGTAMIELRVGLGDWVGISEPSKQSIPDG